MIELIMEPHTPPMSWEQFCRVTPPYSIAIDGYVNTGPRYQKPRQGGPRANYNHHEEVARLPTRATCAQVLLETRLGLFEAFRVGSEPTCKVFANDCDYDVCATWVVLKHSWIAEQVINPQLNKLISAVDFLDTTGGAYPYPKDMPLLRHLAWVFEPYTDFRFSGQILKRIPHQFVAVVENVESRILDFLQGNGKTLPLNFTYEVLGGGSNWKMVREIGPQARTKILFDGIKAYISVREGEAGVYHYTFFRISDKIDFDVPGIIGAANRLENDPTRTHGGGDTIGGTDRDKGSKISPELMLKLVLDHQASLK